MARLNPSLAAVAMLALFTIPTAARAESDLCTFGWGRDLHDWLTSTKELVKVKQVFCDRKAHKDADHAVGVIAKGLASDGYHVTVAPHVQEIELDEHPSVQLKGALLKSKCLKKGVMSVLVVCASVVEEVPHGIYITTSPVHPEHLPPFTGDPKPSGAPQSHLSEGQRAAQ